MADGSPPKPTLPQGVTDDRNGGGARTVFIGIKRLARARDEAQGRGTTRRDHPAIHVLRLSRRTDGAAAITPRRHHERPAFAQISARSGLENPPELPELFANPWTVTSLSDPGNDSGLSKTLLTTVNMTVVAPMPRAKISTATTANPGFWRKCEAHGECLARDPPASACHEHHGTFP